MGTESEAPPSQISKENLAALVTRAEATPPGCFLEVGVFQGGSAWFLAQAAARGNRALYLFDTFTGIPYAGPHDSHAVGDFGNCSLAVVQRLLPHAIVVAGVFPGSAQAMQYPPTEVAFAHLDCDQERSYAEALAYLWPLIVPRGVVWCDDANCIPGARRAVEAFLTATPDAAIIRPPNDGKWQIEKVAV